MTITSVERVAALERADDHALDHHAADEREGERGEERQAERHAGLEQPPGDERAEHRHLALGEVDDAGRTEDQDERERDGAVDRARGDPVDDDLDEPSIIRPPGTSA